MTKPSRCDVISAARNLGAVVEVRGHGVHGVEQHRQRPVELLAAAGEHDVLLAELNQLGAVADAVRRGRAGRGDRIAHALDAIGRGQRRRVGRTHGLGDLERANLFRALLARGVGGLHDGAGRRTAGANDQPGPLVGDVGLLDARVADRLLHGDIVPRGALAHEAAHLAVDHPFPVELRRAMHLAAKAELGIFVSFDDAGFRFAQRGENFLHTVADGGDDPHAGHDHTFHEVSSLEARAALLQWVRRQPARLRPPGTARPSNPWPYKWSRRRPSTSRRRCQG